MSKGKTVFILGAGATRGCSFVNEMKGQGRCIPPLDGDFFTQLQRVSSDTHKKRINDLIEGLAKWFGTNYKLSMEQVFCHFEHAEKLAAHLGKGKGSEYQELVKLKIELEQSIALILGESLTEGSGGKGSYKLRTCDWHDKIVKDLTDQGDAFISFNYDCILDDSLMRNGGKRWNPHYGYGFKLKPSGKGITGKEHWNLRPNDEWPEKDKTIRVHKAHGSLHFREDPHDLITLKKEPYRNPASGNMKFAIIPPESAKAYSKGRFGLIIRDAYKSLRAATRVVVIGYSLPPSDQHAEALLRFGVKRRALDSLVIVNPDQPVRARIRSALQNGLKETTRVHSFDYLSEFVQAEPSIWKI
jgi:hypothetical protein